MLFIGVAQFDKANMAKRRKFRAWPDAARYVARTTIGLVGVGNTARDGCSSNIEFVGLLRYVVFRENGGETTEACSFNRIDANIEKRAMHRLDDIGSGEAQHFVAAFK